MKILIDADGCPVVDITYKIAKEENIECIIICDTSHCFSKEGAKTITVSKGADSADFALVNMIETGDIVVTQDYGLAAMSLAKKSIPISQNGMVYDESNIDALMFTRYNAKKIRRAGGKLKGPTKRKSQQDKEFENKLRKIIGEAKNS